MTQYMLLAFLIASISHSRLFVKLNIMQNMPLGVIGHFVGNTGFTVLGTIPGHAIFWYLSFFARNRKRYK